MIFFRNCTKRKMAERKLNKKHFAKENVKENVKEQKRSDKSSKKEKKDNSEFMIMTTLRREFFIDCTELNSYEQSLQEKIGNLSECDQSCGYILSTNPQSMKILNNTISPDYSGVNFNVEFTAKTLKPKKGRIFHGEICMIISSGVLVDVEEKIKILIPHDKLVGYKFQENPPQFCRKEVGRGKEGVKNSGNILRQFSAIMVRIEDVEYVNRKYNCIGTLVE